MGRALLVEGLRTGSLAARAVGGLTERYRAEGTGRLSNSCSGSTVGATMRLLGSDTRTVATARRGGLPRPVPLLRRAEILLGFDRADVDHVIDAVRHRASAWRVAQVFELPLYGAEDQALGGKRRPG